MSKAPHQETLKHSQETLKHRNPDPDAPPSEQPEKHRDTDPAAAPFEEFDEDNLDYNQGRFHGLTPDQIKKIEEARYDDTEGVPPPVQGPPPVYDIADAEAANEAERKKAVDEHEATLDDADKKHKAKAEKDKADEDEAEKKRKAK
jgi:hypothetical protein